MLSAIIAFFKRLETIAIGDVEKIVSPLTRISKKLEATASKATVAAEGYKKDAATFLDRADAHASTAAQATATAAAISSLVTVAPAVVPVVTTAGTAN